MCVKIKTEMEVDVGEFVSPKTKRKMKETTRHMTLAHWTEDELNIVLKQIKEHGSDSCRHLHTLLDNKTKEDISQAISYFKSQAHNILESRATERPKVRKKQKECEESLSKWARLLCDKYKLEQLHSDTGRCLHLISQCESMPDPEDTANVDFRKMYQLLGDAMEGRPLPDIDKSTLFVLQQCLAQTVIATRKFMPRSKVKEYVEYMSVYRSTETVDDEDLMDKKQPLYTDSTESRILSDLATEISCNPFRLPVECVKLPTSGELGFTSEELSPTDDIEAELLEFSASDDIDANLQEVSGNDEIEPNSPEFPTSDDIESQLSEILE